MQGAAAVLLHNLLFFFSFFFFSLSFFEKGVAGMVIMVRLWVSGFAHPEH